MEGTNQGTCLRDEAETEIGKRGTIDCFGHEVGRGSRVKMTLRRRGRKTVKGGRREETEG